MDQVRRKECKLLKQAGRNDLTGTKYACLTNLKTMVAKQRQAFQALRESNLKTARAWAIKEFAMSLWHYVSRTWAEKGWQRWYSLGDRSQLEQVKKWPRPSRPICGVSSMPSS